MIRKLLLVAAAAAMPIGIIAATGGLANASGTPPVNATTATITCTGISGSAKFNPPITKSETAGGGTTTIKATLSGCTTAAGVTVTSAKVAGVLDTTRTAGENGCTALAGGSSATGNLVTTWKTSPKLVTPTSTIQVTSIAGSVGSNGNATFSIPGNTPNGTASGSFQGSNHGDSDVTDAQTTTSAAAILTTCEGTKGLKSINITSPASGDAVSLG
jgi:hypothetical protein